MLMRTPRSQGISIKKGKTRRLSDAEAAHLDTLLDDALRETFPASDPIAICIDRPLEALTLGDLQDPDKVALPPQAGLKATEPKSTLTSLYDANLWGINQIFDWWLALVAGRSGK
jgi:hypothetical protein